MKKRFLALLLTGTLFVQSGIALAAEISVDDSEEITEEIVVIDSENSEEEAVEPTEEAADETQETESEETVAEESVQAIAVEDGTIVDSGTCGENLTWALDDAGTLTISGEGRLRRGDWEREKIYRIKMNTGVTDIEDYAFYDCNELTEVGLPDSIQTIGNSAFEDNYSLTSITIPKNVSEIGEKAFAQGHNLCTIFWNTTDLPVIAENAFENIRRGTLSYYPDTWGSIPTGAEYGGFLIWKNIHEKDSILDSGSCDENTAWVLDTNGTLTVLGSGMMTSPPMQYDDRIKQVVIEEGVQSIDSSALSLCNSLKSVQIADSVNDIGNAAFSECTALETINLPKNLERINGGTFHWCQNLKSITLPEGIKYIGNEAFNLTGLTEIELPESLEEIGDSAFAHTNLETINLPKNLERINGGTFHWCQNLKSITLPEGIKYIGNEAFNLTGLTEIELPESLEEMGNGAFAQTKLKEVLIPKSVKRIGADAFMFCKDLKTVLISDGVKSIGAGAFSESGIEEIILPDSLTTLEDYLFCNCESLKSVKIGSGTTQIGEYVFGGCTSLEEVEVDPSNPSYQSIDGVLYNKSGTEIIAYPEGKPQYEVPETVEEIPDNAFSYNLNDLTVGTGVTSVGDEIFDAAEPESTSTSSVSTQSAIKIASASKKVTFKGNAPKFKPNAFKRKTVIAYYPAGNSTWTSSVRKNYGGKVTWIATGKIPASSCSMTLSKTIFTYNGKVQKPTVTVKDPNGKTISSSNYKVTYSSGCKNIGEYKVTVKFNGSKYTGSLTKTFAIGPKSTSLKSLTTGTKYFTAKWTKQPTLTSGYQLRYATNSKFTGAKTVTIASIKTTSKKITGLKDATKYYVQIRTYKTVSGKKYYSNWSSAKTVTTKAPVPKATSLTSVTAASKGFTAKWSKQTTQTTGYQLQYSTSSKFTGAKTVWITSNKTTSKKISGLTAKKKYYVRIRTYKTLNGKKYYSSWSKTKTVTTKK